jgi:hypothetical protein
MDVSFFTAVSFNGQAKSLSEKCLQKVDDYFYLKGKKAQVIAGRVNGGKVDVVLSNSGCSQSCIRTALKVLSYFTIILPLIFLMAKAILRSVHKFEVIDVKQELAKEIDVKPEHIAAIERLLPKIRAGKDDPEIQWLKKNQTEVFRLTSAPHLVFKMHTSQNSGVLRFGEGSLMGDAVLRSRLAHTVKAKEICLINQLDLLTIPQVKQMEVSAEGSKLTVLAEQSLDVRAEDSAQEEIYRTQAKSLNKTVNQLATFIAETGFCDVIWRNIPVIDEATGFQGDLRIGLIDLEEMSDARGGLIGGADNGSVGLVNCLFDEDQIDAVLKQANQKGILRRLCPNIKQKRLDQIAENQRLLEFYQKNGILNDPRKPLAVDIDALGLNLDEVGMIHSYMEETESQVTMRQVVGIIIAQINKEIQKTKEGESVKGKRFILLNTNDRLRPYYLLGMKNLGLYTFDDVKQSWMNRIIDALIKKGHLFKLDRVNGHGYFIQA